MGNEAQVDTAMENIIQRHSQTATENRIQKIKLSVRLFLFVVINISYVIYLHKFSNTFAYLSNTSLMSLH